MSILVTGGSGQVGKELQQILPDATYISSNEYNLTVEEDVNTILETRFDTVIHLAAKVGGIIDNIDHPAEYFSDNILINLLTLYLTA